MNYYDSELSRLQQEIIEKETDRRQAVGSFDPAV